MPIQVLNNLQERLLKEISQTSLKDNFFLTGGTALSVFYLQHRYSDDLDFFTEVPEAIKQVLPLLKSIQQNLSLSIEPRRTFETFTEIIVRDKEGETTILHFAQDSPYRLMPVIYNKDYEIYIDNSLDISCNKFSALFDRHDMRDFVDIYFIDKEIMKFEEVYSYAKKKHIGLDEYWLSQAIRYINDLTVLPKMIKPVTLNELRDFFNEKIRLLMSGL